MTYHRLKLDPDNFVTGYGSSGKPPDNEVYPYIMDDSEFQAWGGELRFPSSNAYRWKVISDALVEQQDNRPTIRFTPSSIDEPVHPSQTVSLTIEKLKNGVVDTNFNKTVKKELSWKGTRYPCDFVFVNGVCSVAISRSEPHISRITDNPVFKVEAPLEVRVYSDKL